MTDREGPMGEPLTVDVEARYPNKSRDTRAADGDVCHRV